MTNHIMELAEAYVNQAWQRGRSSHNALEARAALEAEVERVSADAARYRWLNNPANGKAADYVADYGITDPRELDAAIDAAMKEQK